MLRNKVWNKLPTYLIYYVMRDKRPTVSRPCHGLSFVSALLPFLNVKKLFSKPLNLAALCRFNGLAAKIFTYRLCPRSVEKYLTRTVIDFNTYNTSQ
jgi:hypothetical protein